MLPVKTYSSPIPSQGSRTTSGVMASAVQLAPRPRGAQWLLGSKALADMLQDSLEDMKMTCLFYFKIHGYIG